MRLPVNQILPLAALVLIGGCASGGGPEKAASVQTPANGPAADYPIVVGEPFVVDGTTYTPADRMNVDEVGYAGVGAEGGNTVSIAHKTLPLPSYAEVTSLVSGKTILVRIERRGPMSNQRLIELSPGAAAQLAADGERIPVRVRRVNPPEVERAMLRSGQRAPDRMDTPKPLVAVLMRKLDPQAVPPTQFPAPAPAPTATATPKPQVTPVPRPTPTPRATPTPRPTPSPRATPTPRPVPSPTPRPTPSASASPAINGSVVVQVATFSSRANADAAAARLGGQVTQGGRFFRLRMGPFASRAEAEAALARARRAGYRDASIQRAN